MPRRKSKKCKFNSNQNKKTKTSAKPQPKTMTKPVEPAPPTPAKLLSLYIQASHLITPKFTHTHHLSPQQLLNNRKGFNILETLATVYNRSPAHADLGEHYFTGLDGVPETPDKIKSTYHYYSFIKNTTNGTNGTNGTKSLTINSNTIYLSNMAYNISGLVGNLDISSSIMLKNDYFDLSEMRRYINTLQTRITNLCTQKNTPKNNNTITTSSDSFDGLFDGLQIILYYLMGIISERFNDRADACVKYNKCIKLGLKLNKNIKTLKIEMCILQSERHIKRIMITANVKDDIVRKMKHFELNLTTDMKRKELENKYSKESIYTKYYTDKNKPIWRNYLCVNPNDQSSICILNIDDEKCEKYSQISKGNLAMRKCITCGKIGYLFNKCNRCGQVRYCSRKCQKLDWKDNHSLVCKKK